MGNRWIRVRGAREHTLKDVAVDIPRDRLVVLTGLSGSGKSSLAFDTLYTEGKRRYVESLSAFARQLFEQVDKPDVDYVEGLPPTIAIEQRQATSNPRSTVATVTEVHDYLRLLFARTGRASCGGCGAPLRVPSREDLIEELLGLPAARRFLLLAPEADAPGAELRERLERLRADGFARARIDGRVHELCDMQAVLARLGVEHDAGGGADASGNGAQRHRKGPSKAKGGGSGKGNGRRKRGGASHRIEVVIDRLAAKPTMRHRIAESLETALERGQGLAIASVETPFANGDGRIERRFVDRPLSDRFACARCRTAFPELSPRLFSFNAPDGACPVCDGLGTRPELDPELIVPDPDLSLGDGAIEAWRRGGRKVTASYNRLLQDVARKLSIPTNVPYRNLPAELQRVLMYGTTAEDVQRLGEFFEGVIPHLAAKYQKTESPQLKARLHAYMSDLPCPGCRGARLRPEALRVRVGGPGEAGRSIADVLALSIEEALAWCEGLRLEGDAAQLAPRITSGIAHRLRFMQEVGVGYLTLDRAARTLSGGELQRIRLAAQVGSGLAGICYVLDEPTIGLHQRDNTRLIETLERLRDAGNTVIVVEHDEQTIRRADHVIDMGPGAGVHGGEVVAAGTLDEVLASERSLTAAYLKGELEVTRPRRPRRFKKFLTVRGARAHNLKGIDARFPMGGLVCVTGVSGSGKSTLVREVLYKALARKVSSAMGKPGAHDAIAGAHWVERVVEIDQSPIGRTPRSNPATFAGVFNPIRRLFSSLKEARIRGYAPARFSFNVKGGRCEACQGQGEKRIEMHFLPDALIRCEVCRGSKYSREILEVRYRGRSIADVLDMTVESARRFFTSFQQIREPLRTLEDVGLGYLTLGQSSTTLSGGEAQRLKLASELSRGGSRASLYILDEPTTGLHFADISRLLDVLNRLVHHGSTVVVIEHNLDVIRCADWLVDLGPEGGAQGGRIVCEGPPEAIAACEASHTGRFLRAALKAQAPEPC